MNPDDPLAEDPEFDAMAEELRLWFEKFDWAALDAEIQELQKNLLRDVP